jgi:hypothetical protein
MYVSEELTGFQLLDLAPGMEADMHLVPYPVYVKVHEGRRFVG